MVVCHTKRNCSDKNRQKKKRLCSLFSERVDLNMRSKTNPELEFCKKNQLGYLCHFWYSVLLKIGVWALNRFSLRKILFCYIWKNQGGFDHFKTKIDSWAKFERNWFFDPKHTGLLLESLRPERVSTKNYDQIPCRIVARDTHSGRVLLTEQHIKKGKMSW